MNNGEKQVYPLQNHNGTILQTGLTKREYFAGLAMQGLLATIKHSFGTPNVNEKSMENALQRHKEFIEDVITESIKYTDELLKQLENETTK